MDGTIIQQGSFVSGGVNTTLNIISGVDWIKTFNATKIAANTASAGKSFEYYVGTTGVVGGLANGSAWELQNNGAATAVNLIVTTTGFTVGINSATAVPGAPVAVTAISAANPPVVSTGSTTGLATDSGVVEIINVVGAQQFGGMTFSVGTVALNTSFVLKYAPQIVAGTTGFYRIIPFDPIFFPRRRFITAITTGTTTQIKMSVQTTYTAGQLVRIVVPAAYGSISANIDGLTATVLSINATTNVVTVDLDSTGMGTFVFPLTAAVPFTQAQLSPVGAGTNPADLTNLGDAVENRAVFGVRLAGGTIDSPAGQANDVIYWIAGKSFSTTTTVA